MIPTPVFHLPQDLPPKTALALFDLLSGLTDALWQQYEIELVELIMDDLNALSRCSTGVRLQRRSSVLIHLCPRLARGSVPPRPAWDISLRFASNRSSQFS